jgi:hypothetical protein
MHAYYTDLVNYFLREAQQQKLQLQAEVAREKDAHAKTAIALAAAQAKIDAADGVVVSEAAAS